MSLKFKPRKGIYSDSSGNCTLNPSSLEAYSYSWYVLCRRFGSVPVLNTYRYSVTTAKHARDVRQALGELGIENVLEIEAPGGLQDLASAKQLYQSRINELLALVNKKGTRKSTNEQRLELVAEYDDKLRKISALKRFN